MTRMNVVVTEPIDRVGLEMLAAEANVLMPEEPTLAAVLKLMPQADGIVVRVLPCTREVIEAAPNLRVIGKHGVGVDNIDIPAATERGIPVFNTPGTNAEAVAEMAFALMMALARNLRGAQRAVEANQYDSARTGYLATELQGKTLGLIGLGRIGSTLAQKCGLAFSMRVLAYDPYVTTAPAIPGVNIELVKNLDDMLAAADFVSIHVPLTSETRDLMSAARLAKMKPTAYLVNTSRGGIVNEEDLAVALRNGVIAGAGIDVFAQEPTPASHPLFGLDNAIVTPHVGGQTAEAMAGVARDVAAGVLAGIRGERPAHVLNPAVYERK